MHFIKSKRLHHKLYIDQENLDFVELSFLFEKF